MRRARRTRSPPWPCTTTSAIRRQTSRTIEHVREQRFACERMQHLRKLGAHSLAKARREDDDVHFSCIIRRLREHFEYFVENLNTRLRRWLLLALVASCLSAAGVFVHAARLRHAADPRAVADQPLRRSRRQTARDRLPPPGANVLQWHRDDELPQYGGFLRRLDERVRARVDAAEVARTRDRVGQAWELFADRLAPAVVELALTLRPEQIAQLRERAGRVERVSRDLPRRNTARAERGPREAGDQARRVLPRRPGAMRRPPRCRGGRAALPAVDEAWLAEREARQRVSSRCWIACARADAARAGARDRARALASMWDSQDPQRHRRLEQARSASDALTASMVEQADAASARTCRACCAATRRTSTHCRGRPARRVDRRTERAGRGAGQGTR